MTKARLMGVLFVSPALIAWIWLALLASSRYRSQLASRVYVVRYTWDDGIKSVGIVNLSVTKQQFRLDD